MATAHGLPIGFADQVLDLEIRLEEEESLEVIQILSQMYRVILFVNIDSSLIFHRE